MDSSLKPDNALFLQLNEAAVRAPFSKRVAAGEIYPFDSVVIIDTEDYDLQVWPMWHKCDRCNYDRHLCPGCGASLRHYGPAVCAECAVL